MKNEKIFVETVAVKGKSLKVVPTSSFKFDCQDFANAQVYRTIVDRLAIVSDKIEALEIGTEFTVVYTTFYVIYGKINENGEPILIRLAQYDVVVPEMKGTIIKAL